MYDYSKDSLAFVLCNKPPINLELYKNKALILYKEPRSNKALILYKEPTNKALIVFQEVTKPLFGQKIILFLKYPLSQKRFR